MSWGRCCSQPQCELSLSPSLSLSVSHNLYVPLSSPLQAFLHRLFHSFFFLVVFENSLWTEQQLIPGTYLFDMFIFLMTWLRDHKLDWKLLCVTLSQRPWLNKLIISYTILPLSHNDIPRGCEHVSVPAKHLPLLPAHHLIDETDGRGRETTGLVLITAPESERRSPTWRDTAEISLETRKLQHWSALKAILFLV